MKKELSILIGLVALWCLGIVIAPLYNDSILSQSLYGFYSIVCHQFESRSFHIHDQKLAVCIRCFSIYTGFLFALIVVSLPITVKKIQSRTFIIFLLLTVPILLDGISSLFGFTTSTTVTRILTGSFFGIGLGLLLYKSLSETLHDLLSLKRK